MSVTSNSSPRESVAWAPAPGLEVADSEAELPQTPRSDATSTSHNHWLRSRQNILAPSTQTSLSSSCRPSALLPPLPAVSLHDAEATQSHAWPANKLPAAAVPASMGEVLEQTEVPHRSSTRCQASRENVPPHSPSTCSSNASHSVQHMVAAAWGGPTSAPAVCGSADAAGGPASSQMTATSKSGVALTRDEHGSALHEESPNVFPRNTDTARHLSPCTSHMGGREQRGRVVDRLSKAPTRASLRVSRTSELEVPSWDDDPRTKLRMQQSDVSETGVPTQHQRFVSSPPAAGGYKRGRSSNKILMTPAKTLESAPYWKNGESEATDNHIPQSQNAMGSTADGTKIFATGEVQTAASIGATPLDKLEDISGGTCRVSPQRDSGVVNMQRVDMERGSNASGSSQYTLGTCADKPWIATTKCYPDPLLLRKNFPCCHVHFPMKAACCMVLVMPVMLMAALWPSVVVDTNFDAFLQADSVANDVRNAFHAALPSRGRQERRRLEEGGQEKLQQPPLRHIQHDRRRAEVLDPSVLHKIMRIRLVYRAKTERGLLNPEALAFIRDLELRLRDLPGWQSICGKSSKALLGTCEPGFSLVNHVWPERPTSDEPALLKLNGRGLEPLPIVAAVALVHVRDLAAIIFPRDWVSTDEHLQYLRSEFEFNMRCCMVDDPMVLQSQLQSELNLAFEEFVQNDLHPALLPYGRSDNLVDVFWDGDFIESLELWNALRSDSLLAVGSALFIFFYLSRHTGSMLVSSGALAVSMLSIPAAVVTSARVSGSSRISGAYFLSLFLIVGLGADVVIVFITFWKAWKPTAKDNDDQAVHILYMYKHAGFACLATSLTTSCSFFANLLSALRPLREFGFFMGLCIMYTYCFLFIGLPSLLALQEQLNTSWLARKIRELRQKLTETCLPNASVCDFHLQLHERLSCITNVATQSAERLLVRYSWCLFLGGFVVIVALGFWTANVAKLDSGLPSTFPKGHNQHRIKGVTAKFSTGGELPYWLGTEDRICFVSQERLPRRGPTSSGCGLRWCAASGERPPLPVWGHVQSSNGSAKCVCKPLQNTDCVEATMDAKPSADIRLVGLQSVPDSFWGSDAWTEHIRAVVKRTSEAALQKVDVKSSGSARELGTLVQEHWESGVVRDAPYLEAPGPDISVTLQRAGKVCNVAEDCYCGTFACDLPENAQDVSPDGMLSFEVPVTQQRKLRWASSGIAVPTAMHSGRQLQAVGVGVSVIWGIVVTNGAPLLGDLPKDLWAFSTDFKVSLPSVQRHLKASCQKLDTQELLVNDNKCWIREFHNWLRSRGKLFPTRRSQFHAELASFLQQNPVSETGSPFTEFMWFNDKGELAATFFSYTVGLSQSTSSSVAMKQQALWDKHIAKLNAEGSMDAGKAWHTSSLWVRAEAEQAIVGSTMTTLAVSTGSGFLGALFFTQNILLSALVVYSVLGVTTCLAWFMCAAMGWALGAIEVLGLIVFVGYSLTYSLHIAHKYHEHMLATCGNGGLKDRRKEAVLSSLRCMTSAVCGSALTTLGSACFLFFCTIQIFTRLVMVLFAVTFFAALFATIVLPTVLLCIGPGDGCCCIWNFSKDSCCNSVQAFATRMAIDCRDSDGSPCQSTALEEDASAGSSGNAPYEDVSSQVSSTPPIEQAPSEDTDTSKMRRFLEPSRAFRSTRERIPFMANTASPTPKDSDMFTTIGLAVRHRSMSGMPLTNRSSRKGVAGPASPDSHDSNAVEGQQFPANCVPATVGASEATRETMVSRTSPRGKGSKSPTSPTLQHVSSTATFGQQQVRAAHVRPLSTARSTIAAMAGLEAQQQQQQNLPVACITEPFNQDSGLAATIGSGGARISGAVWHEGKILVSM